MYSYLYVLLVRCRFTFSLFVFWYWLSSTVSEISVTVFQYGFFVRWWLSCTFSYSLFRYWLSSTFSPSTAEKSSSIQRDRATPQVGHLPDSMIDYLVDWRSDVWEVDYFIDWFVGMDNRQFVWLFDWLIGFIYYRFIDLTKLINNCFITWYTGWLINLFNFWFESWIDKFWNN